VASEGFWWQGLSSQHSGRRYSHILSKLRARIVAKARTFLVKIKAHRGEPLNERADDLVEEGRTLEKGGERVLPGQALTGPPPWGSSMSGAGI
jgi:hypothetical protein